jgi:hypothetical protein
MIHRTAFVLMQATLLLIVLHASPAAFAETCAPASVGVSALNELGLVTVTVTWNVPSDVGHVATIILYHNDKKSYEWVRGPGGGSDKDIRPALRASREPSMARDGHSLLDAGHDAIRRRVCLDRCQASG